MYCILSISNFIYFLNHVKILQVLHDWPMPKYEKNDGKKLSCCPELNHNSDTHLLDTIDKKFQKEFSCVLPFFTNFKNQSFMCDLGGLSNHKVSQYFNAYNGKEITGVLS